MSVRSLLALSHIHELQSKSIDFVLSFPQAEMETEVCMEIPQGFYNMHEVTSCVLKLKRSIYGLKQSNYNFCNKLDAAIKDRHFLPCSTDKCVYA